MSDSDTQTALKQILSGGSILAVSVALTQLFGFVENILLTRTLSTAEYGAFVLAISVLTTLSTVTQFGLGSGLKRYASEYLENNDPSSAVGVAVFTLGVSGVLSLISATVLVIFAEPMASVVFRDPTVAPLLKGISGALLAKTVLDVSSQGYLAHRKPVLSAFSGGFGQSGLRALVALAGAIYGFSVSQLVLGISLLLVVLSVLLVPLLFRFFETPVHQTAGRKTEYRRLLRFSLPLFLSSITGRVLAGADYLLLGVLSTTVALGYYRPAFLLATAITIAFRGINRMAYPELARLYSSNSDSLDDVIQSIVTWGVVLTLPIVLWMLAFPGESLRVIFGDGYQRGAPILTIISVVMFVDVFVGPVGSLLEVLERSKTVFATYLGASLLNVVLNVSLIPAYGGVGAAVGTGVSLIALNLMQHRLVTREIDFSHDIRTELQAMLVAIIFLVPAWLLVSSPRVRLLLAPFYYVIVVSVTVRLTPLGQGWVANELRSRLSGITNRH